MSDVILKHHNSVALKHEDTCSLVGITPDFTICAEEIYSNDHWVARHAFAPDGTFLWSFDEKEGKNQLVLPPLPESMLMPAPVRRSTALNFAGARFQGLRELERIQEIVKPLSIAAKMSLIPRIGLNIMPPMLLGVAESYVMAEAELIPSELYLVCRRVRLAYLLAQPQKDAYGTPYDYDTVVMHLAHFYTPEQFDEVSIDEAFAGLPGVVLHHPMDCMLFQDHLIVADGGGAGEKARVHIWEVER